MIRGDFISLRDAVEALFPSDSVVSCASGGSGGCINRTKRIILKSGKSLFLKENDNSPPDMFKAEALGLEYLKKTYPLKVPNPLAWGREGNKDFIILENIEKGELSKNFWSDFGRALAGMHKQNDSSFYGFESNNYIGSTKQVNNKKDNWISFFAENRLIYQVELARSKGLAGKYICEGVYNICKRINILLSESDYPSLLHGDLWSGNYMIGKDGQAVLIDPAVYYGNREADIAMTELFGGFDRLFYNSYNNEYPLDKDYALRKDLYNLYHMLNHLNLFGASYSSSVRSIISKYL